MTAVAYIQDPAASEALRRAQEAAEAAARAQADRQAAAGSSSSTAR